MQDSEWGDPPVTSTDEEEDTSDTECFKCGSSKAAAEFPFLSCRCSDCARHETSGAPQRDLSGAPPGGPSCCSAQSRPAAGAAALATAAATAGDSINCRYTEGLPVPVMMLQYPLFFCDVDLPFTLELKRSWREIGGLAFWTLSSAKEGNGVEALRDNNSQTFWQSEGHAPHTVSLQFNKEMKVTRVDLLVNLQQDESYTPKRVQIKLGASPATLSVVRDVEFALAEEQNCWWGIELNPTHAIKLVNGLENHQHDSSVELALSGVDNSEYLQGACLQIAVLTTHQQGRDTHIRQVRVYGPIEGAEDADGCLRDAGTALPSRNVGSAMQEDPVYGIDLVGDGADTPSMNARLTSDFTGLNRAWSQDFFAALTGTQPAPP